MSMTAVTLDDVRQAIGDTDPAKTSASKVRALLGRGSFETIQRHIVALRQEAIARADPEAAREGIPLAPTDVVNLIWTAAYTAARVEVLVRINRLASERDEAREWAASLGRDIETLTAGLDDAQRRIERHERDLDEVRRGKDAASARSGD